MEHILSQAESYKTFRTGKDLYQSLKNPSWDVVILGWHVVDIEGLELLRWIKATFPVPPPIVFVTADAGAHDIVTALDQGADDFILEPADKDVVRARIEALMRRTGKKLPAASPPETVVFGQYTFHIRHQFVEISGQRVSLRPKEYELAMMLFTNVGHPLSREFLHQTIWGTEENIPSRTLDTHLSRLRSKLRLIKDNGFEIAPVYGFGYRLARASVTT